MNRQGERGPVETIGASVTGMIEPCPANPRFPEAPVRGPADTLAVSFSGGGWRAALAAAGVVRFLADARLLESVRWASSVSGGSITNGLLASSFARLKDARFEPAAVDDAVLRPLLSRARDDSLERHLIANAWRAIGPLNRTQMMADIFDRWFFDRRTLSELPTECRFVFNAANATTGVRFGFERDYVGDYVLGYLPSAEARLRVADAVAASAAVPGAFAALRLPGRRFPCGDGADARLLDGGVYDNLGLEAIDDLYGPCLIVLSAGGLLLRGLHGALARVPILRDLKRSEELLYRQVTALRSRTMVDRFKAWEQTPTGQDPPGFARRGVIFGLATSMKRVNPQWAE